VCSACTGSAATRCPVIDSTKAQHRLGNLEHLDPNTAEIGENVRDAVDLSKDFLASLRETGP
jgi:ParB family chromosome partitioning protein